METIALYPASEIGHLISMVELGKLILRNYPSFNVIILIIQPPFKQSEINSYIDAVSAANPSIRFHRLPIISLDPNSYPSGLALLIDLYRLNHPYVNSVIQSLSPDFTVRCLIIDLFCSPALDVAAKLNIPAYFFFTSGASCLALFFHLPILYQNTTESFKDLDTIFDLPYLPTIPFSDMPEPVLDRTTTECSFFINMAAHLPKAAGILVNTFESLEPKAAEALSDRLCLPNGQIPPIYCIGPLLATTNCNDSGAASDTFPEYLSWLESQPTQSVVFLCFGSRGLFSKRQLQEIALGLERSGQRFLWVVRNPPSENQREGFNAQSDPDLDSFLPEGFLDRTKDRGFVVKSWAAQFTVLSHDSVGGFVTHCGWNSVLESICAGVPMVAWPLYAEQKFNKALLVTELELALPMVESEDGLVSSEEVERRVRELMESEEGNAVRKRVREKSNEAMKSLSNDCPSQVALAKFVESLRKT